MLIYGITDIQNKPSFVRMNSYKKSQITIFLFISKIF